LNLLDFFGGGRDEIPIFRDEIPMVCVMKSRGGLATHGTFLWITSRVVHRLVQQKTALKERF
jgi:hypothetical protein